MKLSVNSLSGRVCEIVKLYERSADGNFDGVDVFPESRKYLDDYFKSGKQAKPPVSTEEPVKKNISGNKIIIALSGGKDSLASAISAKNQGFEVHAFFIKGINKSYTKEFQNAKDLSETLGIPFYLAEVFQKGQNPIFKENPFKNAVICALMLEKAKKLGINRFAFGNHADFTIEQCDPVFNYSDTDFFFSELDKWANNFGDFVRHQYVYDDRNAQEIIFDYEQKNKVNFVLESCIMPVFRRKRLHETNKAKFGVDMPCGSCRKCAMQYIFESEKGKIEKNDAFLNKCRQLLLKQKINYRSNSTENFYNNL